MSGAEVEGLSSELRACRRAGIYLFYDRDGVVDDYVVQVIRSLLPFLDHILVVVNGAVSVAGKARLDAVAHDVLVRGNEGMDVGGYQDGLAHLGWNQIGDLDELVLLNNTFFAPVRPWEPVFKEAAERVEASFWGLTEHAEQRPHPFLGQAVMPRHLQSHFLAVRSPLLRDPAFRRYWETMPPVSSYHDSIAHHESRFTPYFNARGYSSFAVYPAEEFASLNPSLEEPMALLQAGCPALKRRIFFHDPLYLDACGANGADILRTVSQTPDSAVSESMILSGLVRSSEPRTLLANAGLTEQRPDDVASPEVEMPFYAHLHVGDGASAEQIVARLRVLSDARTCVRVILTVDSRVESEAEAALSQVGEDLRGRAELRVASQPDLGALAALLSDAADLLDDDEKDRVLLRLTCAGGEETPEECTAQVPDGEGEQPVTRDLAILLAARSLFYQHPSLGGLGLPSPVRGSSALGHGWQGLRDAAVDCASALGLSVPLDAHSPVSAYRAPILVRPAGLTVLRSCDLSALRTAYGARDAGQLLEFLEVPALLSTGAHYRQLLTGRAQQDYALLEYRYQALAALLPEDVEEAQRYLASRSGPQASLGAMVRRELEHRLPGLAETLKPAYRRLNGGITRLLPKPRRRP
ncbi:MAG: rhamnan synthesis F family protein [Actinomyces urogenitalis]|uniref:Rhamnan synthesis protein F n=2 Tax=Actinomyces urogenitalis TaxID=103621 RepID=C0W8D6_9ACTO|nr:rhamnan synthesis F family protein [Actinomyces urogenitalis]EEH64999.1 rhamnan synthesis protein F [Actinomyces urogenitalis DSM 15434]MBS5976490.1 hypothetical protein [Actinomyces urogenitalis]MDK8834340.1 rhamnan synthesis F family protein [Actinomyces urogenitalis]MDU0972712.1 rhamnan synthesis F family protein [Actinomyces urogenitalis]MDU6152005.1 rhamnan synthesis F family protein [Actinomyces urogenitalis]